MPVGPPTSETPLTYTWNDICFDALIEIGAAAPGDNPDPDEMAWVFRKAMYLIDVWQAMRNKVYSYAWPVYTFKVNTNPILFGPSPLANWSTPQRPVRLESAALILNSGTPVDLPINIRDKDWWALNQVKSIQTNVPTDVYPDYTFPDASLYFWPVMNVGDQCRLQVWTTVQQSASITDPIGGFNGPGTLPPAYRAAIMLTLAETLLSGSNRQPSPTLIASAAIARAAVEGPNAQPPRISLQDSGMPRSGAKKSDFNWMTGGRVGGPPQ